MTFPGPDASLLTKQRYLDRVHRIFDVVSPSGAPLDTVEFRGQPSVTTSTVPPSTTVATLRSVVRTPVTTTARPSPSAPASESVEATIGFNIGTDKGDPVDFDVYIGSDTNHTARPD